MQRNTKKTLSLLAVAALLAGVPAASGAANVSEIDGIDSTWILNGDAIGLPTVDANGKLVLTTLVNSEARSAFFNGQITNTHRFTVTFTYQSGGGADGATFVLHNDPRGTAAIGTGGGLLAVDSIIPSAEIELNLYSGNGGSGYAYHVDGASGAYTTTAPVDITQNRPIDVTIAYDSTTQELTTTLLDPATSATFTQTEPGVDLPSALGETAYIGFTGATGGVNANQAVSNFRFTVADRLLLSSFSGSPTTFSFRTTDSGTSVIAPASAKLTLNGAVVPVTAGANVAGVTEFKYSGSQPFASGATNDYVIEVKDTTGATVTAKGSFISTYALLTAADKVVPDTTKPGFILKLHQNGALTVNSIERAQNQLAGRLGGNLADPAVQGVAIAAGVSGANTNLPITFEVESVINMDIAAGSNGDFAPDDQMPGIPGTGEAGMTDGIAGDIITYLDLTPGAHTIIVNSDDGFRTYVGKINDIFAATVAGEFNDPAGRGATDSAYVIYAAEAGVYPFRTIWEQGGGGGNIKWKEQLADGTKVLLNDVANGGPKAYRSASGPDAGGPTIINSVFPVGGASGVRGDAPITLTIVEGTNAVDTGSIKLTINGNPVSATTTKTGNIITVNYIPSPALPGGPAAAKITYTAGGVTRSENWSFRVSLLPAGTLFIEAEDFNFGHGQWLTNANIGMNGPYVGGDYQDLGDGIGGAACDGSDFGIDYFEGNNITDDPGAAIYRANTPVDIGKRNGPAGLNRGTFDVEVDHDIGWTSTAEWMNYTRKFPVTNQVYKVYARMAHGDSTQQRGGKLSLVTSDPSQCDQTTQDLGTFAAPWTGGWDTWPDAGTPQDALIPMKDVAGTDALVKLSGVQTLRFQFMLGAGDIDYLAFVPAGTGLPLKVTSLKPLSGANRLGSRVPFEAVIEDGDGITIASSVLKLNGNAVTPTSTKSGKTTTISFTPSADLPAGSTNVYSLVFTDNGSPAVSKTNDLTFLVSFTPLPASTLFIETEDFNFGHGQWLTNANLGMNGPYVGGLYIDKGDGVGGSDCDGSDFGIDYHENNIGNDPGAVPAYRAGTDMEIAKPNGSEGVNRQNFDVQVNNDIGWTSAGEWMNYTRVFPTNNYKVFARMAHGDAAQQRGGELSRVTSDATQCDQTTESLGTFSAPWTGGWDTWPDAGTTQDALIPMKDTAGAVATVKIGGLQTLRFTFAEGAGDIDYLAFVPQAAGPATPLLSFTRSDAAITITFEGTLESADVVGGPYATVAGATSPRVITLPPTGSQKFYRARK